MNQTSRRLLFQNNDGKSTSSVVGARVDNLGLVNSSGGGMVKAKSGGTGSFDDNSTGEPVRKLRLP